MMTYEESVNAINSLLRFGMKPGLERMRELLARLKNPQDRLRYVHVAGTNGKGSTCALLSSVLTKAGYCTGLFTSPYVSDFRERFMIDGKKIPCEDLALLVENTLPVVKQMESEDKIITEFEFITALAFQWFAHQNCDIVVLEVGLGGRLDATNVIKPPLVSVIASISLDHTAVLGNTVEQIAFEKAGIIKTGAPVVCYAAQDPAAYSVLESIARERGCRFVPAPDHAQVLSSTLSGTRLYVDSLELRLPFLGGHQVKNAETVLAVLGILREEGFFLPNEAIQRGFESASFPARMEVLSKEPLVILDGAHNPEGTAALAAALRHYLPGRELTALTGMLADKDVDAAMDNLDGLFSKVITLAPKNSRAMTAQALAEKWRARGVAAIPVLTVQQALETALASVDSSGALVICGSLYLAGDVRLDVLERLAVKK